jgi:hypothetical protein
MNRRTKERVDLRLQCRLGPEKVLSVSSASQSQIIGLTSNLSRCGMLMHWLESVELPIVGSDLTVDIDLPADSSYGRRLMRCRTTVVRVIKPPEGPMTVGMKIRNIRFVQSRAASEALAANGTWELETMPPATERLN